MDADPLLPGGAKGESAWFALLFAAALAAAWWSLGGVAADGLIGWDSFPMIAATDGGVSGAFTDELMGGRYPDGRFYRPLTSLSLLVGASGSLEASGLRPLDLVACALGAAFVGLLARRVAVERGGPWWSGAAAGLVAAGAVVLHHAQLEVVPFLPRRADGLCATFLGATAFLAYRGARPWAVGVAALAAVLSKETGVIAVGVACAAEWARPLRGDLESPRDAARGALLAGAVPLAAVGLAVIARFAVLGELGGHDESGFSAAGALNSSKAMGLGAAAGFPGGSLALAALVAFAAFRAMTLGAGRALALPLAWALLALAITAFSGRTHGWYAVHLAPPLALVAGLAVAAGMSHGSRSGLGAALAGAGLLALVAAGGRDPQLRRTLDFASEVAAEQTRSFGATVESLAEGDEAVFAPFFFAAAGPGGSPQVFVHSPYSLAALAELVRDDLAVEVRGQGFVSTRELEGPRAAVTLSAPVTRALR